MAKDLYHENVRKALEHEEPERLLFLAIPHQIYETFFQEPFIQKVIQKQHIKLLVYRPCYNRIIIEKVTKYSLILTDFLEEYSKIAYSNAPTLESQVIADTKRNHFELVNIGWHKGQFIHEIVFHFYIKGDKIVIQQNWTDIKLSKELVKRGVAPDDIEIGFVPVYA